MRIERLTEETDYTPNEKTLVYDYWFSYPHGLYYGIVYRKFSPLPVLMYEKDAHHHLENYFYIGWLWFYFVFAWETMEAL